MKILQTLDCPAGHFGPACTYTLLQVDGVAWAEVTVSVDCPILDGTGRPKGWTIAEVHNLNGPNPSLKIPRQFGITGVVDVLKLISLYISRADQTMERIGEAAASEVLGRLERDGILGGK